MKTIYKWTLAPGEQNILMPTGAEILCVQMQGSHPQLWALCDPHQPTQPRAITICGTGHHMPDQPGRYVGTFQMHDGSLVWHVFDSAQS